jgi:hypothetical protein
MYFLPKIQKPRQDWRNSFHPKMRPIISDTNSITSNLAKHLLPTLQTLERIFSVTVTSSIAVSSSIQTVNYQLNEINPLLATVDVESLFTKIPQDHLMDIIETLLTRHFPSTFDRQSFLHFLSIIITFNTFMVDEKYYLQRIGLPMGGSLSGTLANIYLGYLEENLTFHPDLILYQRYMDDILILSTFTEEHLSHCIGELRIRLAIYGSCWVMLGFKVNFCLKVISLQQNTLRCLKSTRKSQNGRNSIIFS